MRPFAVCLPVAITVLTSPLAIAQRGFGERVNRALEKSRAALAHHLKRCDGGELALVCLAAAHEELPADTYGRAFRKALDRLATSQKGRDTYGLSLRLMLMVRAKGFPNRSDALRRDTAMLLRHQGDGGGFGYRPGPGWDLSNTQYAALGLRAAAFLQQTVPREVWLAMGARVLASQSGDGGWGYREIGNAVTPSMTVAGITVLEVCRQQLEPSGKLEAAYRRAIDGGWRWMDSHAESIGSFEAHRWLYFHYGLERAAILSGRETVGERGWYPAGAAMLLSCQRRDGGFPPWDGRKWGGRKWKPKRHGDPAGTAFAVLFLRRTFQRVLQDGPTTPSHALFSHALPASATDDAVRAAVEADVARGMAAVPDLLGAMRSEIGPRRRAAAMAFLRISGKDFRYHPSRDAAANAEALKAAERWWLDQPESDRR